MKGHSRACRCSRWRPWWSAMFCEETTQLWFSSPTSARVVFHAWSMLQRMWSRSIYNPFEMVEGVNGMVTLAPPPVAAAYSPHLRPPSQGRPIHRSTTPTPPNPLKTHLSALVPRSPLQSTVKVCIPLRFSRAAGLGHWRWPRWSDSRVIGALPIRASQICTITTEEVG
jgi:hypothetical protein